jgi:hypothetical protein
LLLYLFLFLLANGFQESTTSLIAIPHYWILVITATLVLDQYLLSFQERDKVSAFLTMCKCFLVCTPNCE